jgi:hypothetical protein
MRVRYHCRSSEPSIPMFRRCLLLICAPLVAACTGLGLTGLTGLTLTLDEIADRAFVERQGDLARILRAFDAIDIGRPDVALMPESQRLQLGYTISLRSAGRPLAVRLAVSGRPELNAQRTGIDLVDSRIEELRLPAVPLVDLARQFRSGESLGRLPLLNFTPAELNRAGIVYQAAGLALSPRGVRIDLAPR